MNAYMDRQKMVIDAATPADGFVLGRIVQAHGLPPRCIYPQADGSLAMRLTADELLAALTDPAPGADGAEAGP